MLYFSSTQVFPSPSAKFYSFLYVIIHLLLDPFLIALYIVFPSEEGSLNLLYSTGTWESSRLVFFSFYLFFIGPQY